MASVPNSHTFGLRDVVNVVSPSLQSLKGCFTDSIDSYFDPRYKGSKDRLSNFRNYGGFTNLVLGAGTSNHWYGSSRPLGSIAQAWYDAIYDAAKADLIASRAYSTGYAGWHNDEGYANIYRAFLDFDTSAIPADAYIESAALRLYASVYYSPVNPAIAPLQVRISQSNLPLGFEYFQGSFGANESWDNASTGSSVGSFTVNSYAYTTKNISISTSAIRKNDKTWLMPRLDKWDYGYVTGNGLPTDQEAVRYDITKTSPNRPQLTIKYW